MRGIISPLDGFGRGGPFGAQSGGGSPSITLLEWLSDSTVALPVFGFTFSNAQIGQTVTLYRSTDNWATDDSASVTITSLAPITFSDDFDFGGDWPDAVYDVRATIESSAYSNEVEVTIDAADFTPADLWASARGGFWLEPQDTTSMFTQPMGGAGTNPSADGDSAWIIVDKSRMGGLTAAAWFAAQTNGFATADFASDTSWTKESGWTISGGKANFNSSSANTIYQSGFVANALYYIEFTVSDYVSGGVGIRTGGVAVINYATGNGTYKGIIKCNALGTLGFIGQGVATQLSIDNVRSVRLHDGTNIVPIWRWSGSSGGEPLYKTAGGKSWLLFRGVDNNPGFSLDSNNKPATGTFNIFFGMNVLADTSGIMFGQGSNFAGVFTDGSSSTVLSSGAGTNTYNIDGSAFGGTTRDNLHDALTGADRVVEITGVDTSGITNLAVFTYESAGLALQGELYSLIAVPSVTSDERTDIIAYIQGLF